MASDPNASQQSGTAIGNEIPEIRTIEDFDRFVFTLNPANFDAAIPCIDFMIDLANTNSTSGSPTVDEFNRVFKAGVCSISIIAQTLENRNKTEKLTELNAYLLDMARQDWRFRGALKVAFDALELRQTRCLKVRWRLKEM